MIHQIHSIVVNLLDIELIDEDKPKAMILKQKDTRTEDIQELNRLLSLNLSSKQRGLVERELKCLMSGNSGENTSAYYLDFRFGQTKDWIVIHDLRIDHKGTVAQIDHLLINRCLQVHILESKNYFYGIKITDRGEFLINSGKDHYAVESPIQQNMRHVAALKKAVDERNYAPYRLCVQLPVIYKSCILVSPHSNVERPPQNVFDTSMVVKADAYSDFLESEIQKTSTVSMLSMAVSIIGTDTLEDFARKILRLHKPGKFNYAAKFGIDEAAVLSIKVIPTSSAITKAQEKHKPTSAKSCDKCGVQVEEKVAYFCRMNKAKFDGKVLCRECQQPSPSPETIIASGRELSFCDSCNVEVDSKVVFFCRMNIKKFDSNILCRDCQQKY
jgi:hypothetical protein